MGNLTNPYELGVEREVRISPDAYVVASSAAIEALNDAAPAFDIRAVALAPDQPVPARVISNARMLVMEVDGGRASLNRIAQVRSARGDLPLIVAIGQADLALIRAITREGVADVVSLPFDVDELTSAMLQVEARRSHKLVTTNRLAPMIAMVRATGGAGTTSIATHLAAELGKDAAGSKSCCLIDLDLQFGSIASFLRLEPRYSIRDLLEADSRIDEDLLRSVVTRYAPGMDVVAAPDSIEPLESVDTEQLLRTLDLVRREYDFVVLDLPANWTNWALSALLSATSVVIVVELSIASLRQGKRRLELFSSVGLDPRTIRVVVNRVERRLFRPISLEDVEQTLGQKVVASIANEEPLVGVAQDQGLLASSVQRKSRFAADVRKLAEFLRASCTEGSPP